MPNYTSVWQALRGQKPGHLPRGEAFITEEYLHGSGLTLKQLLERLQADLVALPAAHYDAGPYAVYWKEQGYFPLGTVNGPLHGMIRKQGWPGAAALIAQNPGVAEAIMREAMAGIERDVSRALEKGIEAFVVGDDMAGNGGLWIDPVFLRKHYFPLFIEWLKCMQVERIPVLFHSDGDIRSILFDLDSAGFSGLYGLQENAGMKPHAIPAELLAKWVFWGTFQFEDTLHMKAPSRVETAVKETVGLWADVPGYIFGSCSGLYAGLDPEAVQQAYDVLPQ